jgi:hypothetical protein
MMPRNSPVGFMTRRLIIGLRSLKRAVLIVSDSLDISGRGDLLDTRMIAPKGPSEGITSAFNATGRYMRTAMDQVVKEDRRQLDIFEHVEAE